MNDKERAAMEAMGYVFGDAEDFLELNEEERRMVQEQLEDERTLDDFLVELPEEEQKAIDARFKELSSGRIYEFTLILDADDITDDMANRLFEAGCDDATLSRQGGETKLGFDRKADSILDAVASALLDVRKAGYRVISARSDTGRIELKKGDSK